MPVAGLTAVVELKDYTSASEFPVEVLERPWGLEVIVAKTPEYAGKVLHMRSGTRGGLQMHVQKAETFYLFSGMAEVELGDGDGNLTVHTMTPGMSFHIPAGAHHRVTALNDCVLFEASQPSLDDRVHVEHLYGLPQDTRSLPSTWETDDGKTFRKPG